MFFSRIIRIATICNCLFYEQTNTFSLLQSSLEKDFYVLWKFHCSKLMEWPTLCKIVIIWIVEHLPFLLKLNYDPAFQLLCLSEKVYPYNSLIKLLPLINIRAGELLSIYCSVVLVKIKLFFHSFILTWITVFSTTVLTSFGYLNFIEIFQQKK